ncbi:MAG TPA: hypothetical protein VH497_15670 [Vicinamibacterales bacterium]|jgi:hypothetical protein
MSFARAQQIADAVLYEGYALYPYRASAAKNRFRWQFGIVAPRAPREHGEPCFSQTDCLVIGDEPRVSVRVRFLRPHRSATGWLRGDAHCVDAGFALPSDAIRRERTVTLGGADVDAHLIFTAERVESFVKLRLRLENLEPWRPVFETDRDSMLERSLVGAHLLLAVHGGTFVSLLEPPESAAVLVAGCENRHTWPVLVGDRPARTLMLSSPIVLYDYPSVAPESPGDLCDGAEIDEILTLRILAMTDAEKREARATDPLVARILDRVEALNPDAVGALHGAMRSADFFNPPGTLPPDEAFVVIAGRRVAKGSAVRLRPNRRADAMDMFLKDQRATVAGVYRDVDERVHVAVTVDADPAAALHESFGRFFYFDPAEVEPIDLEQEHV